MIVGDFTQWLRIGRPPCAAYRAMMSSRLVALENWPGIRPVGIGETWRRLRAKCLLWVTGQEAKAACWADQLAGGVEAGVKVSIHAMRVLWQEHLQK